MKVQRVERHVINRENKNFSAIDYMCFKSKNLYNYVNYILRQSFIHTNQLPSEYTLLKKFHNRQNEVYYDLCGNTNQQCIKNLYKNWKSFFKSIKDWSKNKSKYLGKPSLPKYKDKNGRNVVVFTYSDSRIKEGYLCVNKKSQIIPIKTDVKNEDYQQVRLIPQSNCYVVEIVYNAETINLNLNKENYLSIDVGVNNFTTCYNSHDNKSFIVNGKVLKSYNQYYNKKRALLSSYLKDRRTSNRLKRLDQKRNNKVNDFMHKASKAIVNYCVKYNIGTVVIGHNKLQKQNSDMSKQNNQKFVSIPFTNFINKMKYKCENLGIDLIETEEGYTSKVDHSVLEEMKHHEKYAGKRKKRGLFKQSSGKVINADLNGAVGILRKVINEFSFQKIVNRGFVINPVKINVLTKDFIENI